MKRKAFWLAILVILSLPVFAGRIVYTVDPSTASPQPATVVAGGEGEVKVIFNASQLESGMVFTFTLDSSTGQADFNLNDQLDHSPGVSGSVTMKVVPTPSSDSTSM